MGMGQMKKVLSKDDGFMQPSISFQKRNSTDLRRKGLPSIAESQVRML